MAGISEIFAALAKWRQNESPLIGVFESQQLEFKRAAYFLNDDPRKAEFAKDVAGMSNAGGGLIVLGIETERDAAAGRDRSARLRPIAMGNVNVPQMESVAKTWIYPPQRGLEIREWPDAGGKLLVSILVPAFDDLGGLSVILGPGTPPDRRTIGIPIRSASGIDFHSAAEIYDWIRRGRLQGAAGIDASVAHGRDAADEQLARVQSEFVDASPTGESILFLQAWPESDTRLERMHDHDGVRGLFLDPPEHRWGAFGWWGLAPEVDSSGGLRVSSGRISFWVTPDAVATLVVGQDYLSWAMEHFGTPGRGVLINSTALAEFTFEFCRAYLMILEMGEPRPTHASFRSGLFRALEPVPLRLGVGTPDRFDYSYSARPAPSDEFVETLDRVVVSTSDGRAEEIAATLLRRLYARFGLGREAIPHLSEDGTHFDPKSLDRRGSA
jgi:hypothetical protein